MHIIPDKVDKMSKEGRGKRVKLGETNPGLYLSYYSNASYGLSVFTVPVNGRTIILGRKIQEFTRIFPNKGQRKNIPHSLFCCTEQHQKKHRGLLIGKSPQPHTPSSDAMGHQQA